MGAHGIDRISFRVGAQHSWRPPRGSGEETRPLSLPRCVGGCPGGTLTLYVQLHGFLREHLLVFVVPELAGKILAVVSPLWLEGELALREDGLGGQEGGGDSRLLQGPLQPDLVLGAGGIQRAGQSDFLRFMDFWRELDVR